MKTWICSSAGSPNQLLPDDDGQRAALQRVLSDTSTANPYYPEIRWAGRLNVYRALTLDDTLMLGDTVLTAFFDSCYTANVGKLYRASAGLHTGKDGSKYLDTLNSMTATIVPEDAWRDVLVVAYNKATDTTLVTDSVSYRLTAVLDSIFPDSTFTVALEKERAWSGSDSTTLESIANECPYEYGVAVYLARTLLAKYDSIPYMGYNTCEQTPPPSSGRYGQEEVIEEVSQTDEMAFVLYPNPNTGVFSIEIDMEEEDRAELMVWSIAGQRIYNSNLNSGNNRVTLNVANGLYLYTVIVNGERKWTGKISVSVD